MSMSMSMSMALLYPLHDHHDHHRQASLSFNEYLRLVSCQRRADPDETTLLAVFETFDPANTGRIPEIQFRKIMSSKATIPDEEVEEMLAEYRKLEIVKDDAASNASSGSSNA